MEKITINASRSYDVITDSGLISKAGQLIREALGEKTTKICIVTDDNVSALYRDPLKDSLLDAGFDVVSFVFPHGEENKTMATISGLLEYLAEQQLTRSDALIALGGGITGDITGFAAASYLRGIQFVQMPTTLLAAVDSSVGGKTGVNLTSGKNLAGAFWQPSLVLFDTDTIKTLPYETLLDGIAESIKAGIIADKELFDYIMKLTKPYDPKVLATLANKAILVKQSVVEADERDTGVRQLLNFGHTLGHAIEKCSDYEISHGHAIAIGMVIVSRACFNMGLSDEDCFTPIMQALNKFKFPMNCPYNISQLAEAAMNDKKRSGGNIVLVVPKSIGNCQLVQLSIDNLEAFIEKGLQ